MSKKSFIDSVEVGSPCTEDWNQMQGTDKIRLCSHCVKHVTNLSEMTRKEATKLVRTSNGNICIRYITDPVTKRPMFAEQLSQITRRTPAIAAGVMTASLSLSSFTHAQEAERSGTDPVVQTSQKKFSDRIKTSADGEATITSKKPSSISGTVTDANGAVIPRSKITIFSVDANKTISTTTNDEGLYRIDNLESGTYRIESESPGFKKFISQAVISGDKDAVADASLEVGMVNIVVDVVANVQMETGALGGVMVAIEYSSPLAKAVADDNIDEVRDLVAKGADVNGKDDNYVKITPLFIAVENGNLEIAELLLNAGAKINARDQEKQTPLMRIDGAATAEFIDMFVRHGAKINLTDNAGNTAIIVAAESVKPEVLKSLINAGADVRLGNKQGQTALMNAASRGEIENVRVLIQSGADVNAKNKEGKTALNQTSDDETRDLLIAYGAITHES